MRRPALAVLALIAVALGVLTACSSEPAEDSAAVTAAPATPVPSSSATTTGPRIATMGTALAPLPEAPPLETWIQKGSDFQMTLDLDMQTAMISRLNISPSDADETAARALAYYICSDLRSGSSSPGAAITALYPDTESFDWLGVELAAQAFCLDTVSL